MGPRVEFLADLTVALAAATLGGMLAARLRLHPILGYLAAGIAIGPFTPGYVARPETLETLATLGLIFLLFSLGLGFSFSEVRALGARAVAGNVVAMALSALAGAAAARLLGFPHPLTIALAVAVSSTAVGAALLKRWALDEERAGRYAFAQLVVQDLISVALLVAVTAPAGALTPAGIALPIGKAIGFVAVALILGATVLHRAVRGLIASGSADTRAAAFAALALVAAWLGYLAGLSFEFGAFVAGAVISEAAGSRVVASAVAPFRAVFVAFFFVSTGMLLDPRVFATAWAPIATLAGVLLVVRIAGWGLLARRTGIPGGLAVLVAIAMTSLGEFNVVLLDEAWRAHRLDAAERQVLLAVTVLSIVLVVAFAAPATALAARSRRAV